MQWAAAPLDLDSALTAERVRTNHKLIERGYLSAACAATSETANR